MSRNSIIAVAIAAVAVAIIAVVYLNSQLDEGELGAPPDLAAEDEAGTLAEPEDETAVEAETRAGEADAGTEDDVTEDTAETEDFSPDESHEASVAISEAAREAARTTGRPVQDALEEVRAIVEEAELVGAADETLPPNDEAAPDADTIGAEEALDPDFVRSALEPEAFQAERVVAIIDASPRLDEEEKAELRVAVQVVADEPEAQRRVLAVLESILIPEATTEDPAVQ